MGHFVLFCHANATVTPIFKKLSWFHLLSDSSCHSVEELTRQQLMRKSRHMLVEPTYKHLSRWPSPALLERTVKIFPNFELQTSSLFLKLRRFIAECWNIKTQRSTAFQSRVPLAMFITISDLNLSITISDHDQSSLSIFRHCIWWDYIDIF